MFICHCFQEVNLARYDLQVPVDWWVCWLYTVGGWGFSSSCPSPAPNFLLLCGYYSCYLFSFSFSFPYRPFSVFQAPPIPLTLSLIDPDLTCVHIGGRFVHRRVCPPVLICFSSLPFPFCNLVCLFPGRRSTPCLTLTVIRTYSS